MEQISFYNDVEIINNVCSLNIGPVSNCKVSILDLYFSYVSKLIDPPKIDPSSGDDWNEDLYIDKYTKTDEYGHFKIDIFDYINVNNSKKDKIFSVYITNGFSYLLRNTNRLKFSGYIKADKNIQSINLFTTMTVFTMKQKYNRIENYNLYLSHIQSIIEYTQILKLDNILDTINIYTNESANLIHAKLYFLILICDYFFNDSYLQIFKIIMNCIEQKYTIQFNNLSNTEYNSKGTIFNILDTFLTLMVKQNKLNEEYHKLYLTILVNTYNSLIAVEKNPFRVNSILSNIYHLYPNDDLNGNFIPTDNSILKSIEYHINQSINTYTQVLEQQNFSIFF